MELELKQIGTILEGDKKGGYKYANRIVRISEAARLLGSEEEEAAESKASPEAYRVWSFPGG